MWLFLFYITIYNSIIYFYEKSNYIRTARKRTH